MRINGERRVKPLNCIRDEALKVPGRMDGLRLLGCTALGDRKPVLHQVDRANTVRVKI